MCGIATVSIGRRCRGRIPYPKLRNLVSELLVELEERGRDASGIAVINDNKVDSVAFKKPLQANRMVVRPRFQDVLGAIDEQTNFVMLHTRASTVGNNAEIFNNHPIIIPGYVGIHNGTLYNHEKLFERHKEDFQRLGKVDSEIILQLYKHHVRSGLESREALTHTARSLRGAFTGAIVDWQHPHRMVMFKHGRSLSIVRIPHYDVLITVSEPRFFTRAMNRLNLKVKIQAFEQVYDGTGIIIDLNVADRITESVQDFDLPVHGLPKDTEGSAWSRFLGF